MSKILNLPERPVREWERLRETIADVLRTQGHEQEAIDHVMEILRNAWMESVTVGNFSVTVTSPEAAMREAELAFHKVTSRLLLRLASEALENHRLRSRLEAEGYAD